MAKKTTTNEKSLSLIKGRHRFRFTYKPGEECEVISAITDMVHRKGVPFDWFDAAVLSHQLGVDIAKRMMPLVAARRPITRPRR